MSRPRCFRAALRHVRGTGLYLAAPCFQSIRDAQVPCLTRGSLLVLLSLPAGVIQPDSSLVCFQTAFLLSLRLDCLSLFRPGVFCPPPPYTIPTFSTHTLFQCAQTGASLHCNNPQAALQSAHDVAQLCPAFCGLGETSVLDSSPVSYSAPIPLDSRSG